MKKGKLFKLLAMTIKRRLLPEKIGTGRRYEMNQKNEHYPSFSQ